MEAGKIAGRGTHHTLLRECPLYQQMWDAEQILTAAFLRGQSPVWAMPGSRVAARVLNIRVPTKSRMGPWREEKGMRAATR